jgi:starch synthase
VHVLFAAAELSPLARVGGLAEAAAGLVKGLRAEGVQVTVALPDYASLPLERERRMALDVAAFAAPASARTGHAEDFGEVTLIAADGLTRPHPYVQADGTAWPDNDIRFYAFSAAVAALARRLQPSVVHLNDWHTATALAHLNPAPPTVFTIHTLGYQGTADLGWLTAFPHHPEAFAHLGACNPLAGAIRLADRVIAVSPTYAREIVEPWGGFGLDELLRAKGAALVGIRNGIDTVVWDPAEDPLITATYDYRHLAAKDLDRSAVREELGLPETRGPLIIMVTRLVDQKGVDLALGVVPYLERLPAQLAVLGSGDRHLVDELLHASQRHPRLVAFRHGYDDPLAHRLFAGGDLLLMPSRFEPCGLAQMQAMRYGTSPIVTDVGGLHDTVVDIDAEPSGGTGVVVARPSELDLVDGLHRATRAWANRPRRDAMRRRGMTADWSWREPACQHIEMYEQLIG